MLPCQIGTYKVTVEVSRNQNIFKYLFMLAIIIIEDIIKACFLGLGKRANFL